MRATARCRDADPPGDSVFAPALPLANSPGPPLHLELLAAAQTSAMKYLARMTLIFLSARTQNDATRRVSARACVCVCVRARNICERVRTNAAPRKPGSPTPRRCACVRDTFSILDVDHRREFSTQSSISIVEFTIFESLSRIVT